MFIRYFADTTGSALSLAALEYMRSFLRVAPVRLISVTGILAGRWQGYGQLMVTPMVGQLYNAVCCDPSRWTWSQKVPAAAKPVDHRQIGPEREIDVPAIAEMVTGNVELYTAKIRNVLFAVAPPRSTREFASAVQYEAIVVQSAADATGWKRNGIERTIVHPNFPHADLPTMRALFVPPP